MAEKKNFERINYNLRPAKHIERKMFCEAFGRLSILDDIKNYRYIGMGSAYFSDFNLFHKSLGITKLLSIEGENDARSKKRIHFNKPFSCIDVKFGWTTSVLPILPWQKWSEKSIVWLDYVDRLKEFMFGDIETVIFNIKPGSVFLISVNIEEDDENIKAKNPKDLSAQDFKYSQLRENVGSESIPHRAKELILTVDNNKSVIREIINNAILSAIRKRNNGFSEDDQIHYKQLFNLYYRDSADMLTVGGIVYLENQKEKVDLMFNNLHFIRANEKSFDIIVPKLTYREIHALDKILPHNPKTKTAERSALRNIPLAAADKKNYSNIYRYFPTFAETNL